MPDDTKHSAIDPEGVLKRTASRQVEQREELDTEIKPTLIVFGAQLKEIRDDQLEMKALLKVALAPRAIHPAVQGVFAIAAVLWTIALVTMAVAIVHPAPARASIPTETAGR